MKKFYHQKYTCRCLEKVLYLTHASTIYIYFALYICQYVREIICNTLAVNVVNRVELTQISI